jgi:hypothetical protein
MYVRDAAGGYRAHSIQLLTPSEGRVARIDVFVDAALFADFGLPVAVADRIPA